MLGRYDGSPMCIPQKLKARHNNVLVVTGPSLPREAEDIIRPAITDYLKSLKGILHYLTKIYL